MTAMPMFLTNGALARPNVRSLTRAVVVLVAALVLVLQTAGPVSAEIYGDTQHGSRREMKERCGQAGGTWIDVPYSGGVCDLPGDSVWICSYIDFTCVFVDVLSEGQPGSTDLRGEVGSTATGGVSANDRTAGNGTTTGGKVTRIVAAEKRT